MEKIDFLDATNPVLHLNVHAKELGERRLVLEVKNLIHGVWSMKDPEKRVNHEKGLTNYKIPPVEDPLPGPVAVVGPTWAATVSNKILQYDNATTAEVEPVLLIDNLGGTYVTVGSDHHDRFLERVERWKSLLYAPQIMSRDAWLYEDVKDHWDKLILRAYGYPTGGPEKYIYPKGKQVLYMQGECGQNYDAERMMKIIREQTGIKDLRNSVLFLGTIPSLNGEFMWSPAWDLELEDPILKRVLRHHYEVEVVWHRFPPISKVEERDLV